MRHPQRIADRIDDTDHRPNRARLAHTLGPHRVHLCVYLTGAEPDFRHHVGARHGVVHERARQRLAVAIINHPLHQRLSHALRHPANPERTVGWIGAVLEESLPGLARKLPHYGKYGWLVFSGEAPDNIRKGQWPVRSSPLSVALAEKAVTRPLAPGPALTDALD